MEDKDVAKDPPQLGVNIVNSVMLQVKRKNKKRHKQQSLS